jgi:excisionase family DNA binding protein
MEPTPSAPAEKITLPELLTVKETAEYLRVPQPTIYYLLQNGKLPGVMIGGRWRVKRLLIDRDILHSVPAEVASAETVSTQDAVGKQINIITAGGKNSTEGLDLLERLLKQSSTQVVSGDTDIEASNVIVLDARTFSERELTQEPLGARVAQNFPPEAHIVLV